MPALVEPRVLPVPDLMAPSGCFETMRAYHGKLFRLEAHLRRLTASAKYLHLRLSLSIPDLSRRLTAALRKSKIQEAVVRVAMIPPPGCRGDTMRQARVDRRTRGGWGELATTECTRRGSRPRAGHSQVVRMIPNARRVASPSIIVQPIQLPTHEAYQRGIAVAIVPTRKFPVSQIDPQSKFSCRLGSIQAVMEAQLRGADEAIFLDTMGYVTESTASNFGMIKSGVFLAPPCWLGLLAGITWQALMEAAHAARIPYREVPLTRHDVYNADEAFLSSTLKEVLPVTHIDRRVIGSGRPGPYSKRLHHAFQALVKRELEP